MAALSRCVRASEFTRRRMTSPRPLLALVHDEAGILLAMEHFPKGGPPRLLGCRMMKMTGMHEACAGEDRSAQDPRKQRMRRSTFARIFSRSDSLKRWTKAGLRHGGVT